MPPDPPLLPLPPQPSGVPWPTDSWPTGEPPTAVVAAVDDLFDDEERFGTTYAVVVAQGGRLLLERYGGELPHVDRPPEPVEPHTPLLSWSMAKSVLHATVGVLLGERRLSLTEPAGVPSWTDERADITLDQLLQMRDGLSWAEDYVDAGVSGPASACCTVGSSSVYATAQDRAGRRALATRSGGSSSIGSSTRSACGPPIPAWR